MNYHAYQINVSNINIWKIKEIISTLFDVTKIANSNSESIVLSELFHVEG